MNYTAEQDPLCYPGSNVLINLADILDQETLDQFELSMFLIRAEEQWPTGRITADYYLRLHHHLFQDVYTWAGELRNIRIGKGGNWFCYPEHIERELERIFVWLRSLDDFSGASPADFARDGAHLLAELNAVHPFREGNGRTQLAFLSLLADRNGLPFDADRLDPERVILAMIESFGGNEAPLQALVLDIVGDG